MRGPWDDHWNLKDMMLINGTPAVPESVKASPHAPQNYYWERTKNKEGMEINTQEEKHFSFFLTWHIMCLTCCVFPITVGSIYIHRRECRWFSAQNAGSPGDHAGNS